MSSQSPLPAKSSPSPNTPPTKSAILTTSNTSTVASAKSKPVNIFSNDGSFLERFQRSKKEEDEKKKQEELLTKKRAFDNRFKNRGKRPAEASPAETSSDPDHPSKKIKSLSQYEKEVKSYEGRSLKDNGTGIRPLVK
ncbi:hypothetical protein FRC03_006443 [Tulasnella sp. 419]|nr:hypothetical protein FRC02_006567 [Tulasnella sp. 418]KAG8968696.1 hypothetical protein FRC03_006443 [Tulasnella sp. 419]